MHRFRPEITPSLILDHVRSDAYKNALLDDLEKSKAAMSSAKDEAVQSLASSANMEGSLNETCSNNLASNVPRLASSNLLVSRFHSIRSQSFEFLAIPTYTEEIIVFKMLAGLKGLVKAY